MGDCDDEWRTVWFAPDYEISESGSLRLRVRHGNRMVGYVLSGTIIRGYQWYNLRSLDGPRIIRSAHSMVLESFVGLRPSPTHQGAHNDSNRSNNHVSNLRWATPDENIADGVAFGSWKGERHAKAILTELEVLEIRRIVQTGGDTQAALARKYGVVQGTISSAVHRRSWTHI